MVVIQFPPHARAFSARSNPNNAGSACLPTLRKASENGKKCSGGIRPRIFHIEGALDAFAPTRATAAGTPPTAATTSSMVESMLITDCDKSRNVTVSSTHGLRLENPCEMGRIAPMYSKAQAAKRLAQTQAALELSNAAIAQKLGVLPNGWSQYRTGDRTIPHSVLVALKEQFGVTSDWILAGDPSGLPHRLYAKIRIAA